MKYLNKLGNILTSLILLIFFSLIIFQNLKYNPRSELNKIDKNIDDCLDNNLNVLDTLECIGKSL